MLARKRFGMRSSASGKRKAESGKRSGEFTGHSCEGIGTRRSSPLPTPHSPLPPLSAFRFPLSSSRSAFTIVELLVVIIIIAILMGFLLPAIMNARTRAQEAKVIIEIKQLESAIAAFKVKYGVEPPSRISIYLTQTGWDADPAAKGVIKRIWPQFDFSMPGGAGQAYPSNWNKTQQINCGECLMFFLGGIYDPTSGAPTGFAKNPAIPFAPRSVASSREGPFMEFDPGRVKDTENSSANNNNMPEYLDSLNGQTKPFLYFSSYDGQAYRVAGASSELPAGGTLADVYRVNSTSATPGPATQGFPAHKPKTFQIISPGLDYEYGLGGVFNPNLAGGGLMAVGDNDNLTNFHSGRLGG